MISKLKNKIKPIYFPIIALWYIFYRTYRPLCVLGLYNHANADDFWMSTGPCGVWNFTHSIPATIMEGFRKAFELWKNWDGCLISMWIGGMPPLIFGEYYYRYTFIIISLSFIIAVTIFLFVLLHRGLKYKISHCLIIIPVALIILVNANPSIKDAFYWWVGGINYTFMFSVFLISQAMLIEYLVSKRIVFLVIGCILAFSTGLGNLLSGLVNPIIVFLELLFILYYRRNDKADKSRFLFIIPFVCAFVGLLCNVLAPGNLIRGGSGLFDNSIIGTIIETIKASTLLLPTYIKPGTGIMYLLLIVLMIVFFNKDAIHYDFKLPGLILIILYGVYCSVFTPVIYAHSAFYGRCKLISYFVMFFLLLISVYYVCGWLNSKIDINIREKISDIVAVIALIITVFSIATGGYYAYDCHVAKADVQTGLALQFHNQVMARQAIYNDYDIKEVYVDKIQWIPGLFYYDDDNLEMIAGYYGKDFIKVKE